jgi:hypothetical protein
MLMLCRQWGRGRGYELVSPSLSGLLDSKVVSLTSHSVQMQTEHSQRQPGWSRLEHVHSIHRITPSQREGSTNWLVPRHLDNTNWDLGCYIIFQFFPRAASLLSLRWFTWLLLRGFDSTLSLCRTVQIRELLQPLQPSSVQVTAAEIVRPSPGCPLSDPRPRGCPCGHPEWSSLTLSLNYQG